MAEVSQNSLELFQLIRDKGPITKIELGTQSTLSHPTVLKHLRKLVAMGLVIPGEPVPSGPNGGRHAEPYLVDPNGRVALGMDITATEIRTALVNLDGEVVATSHLGVPFERSDAYFSVAAAEAQKLLDAYPLDDGKLLGAGIAVPGLVDPQKGLVIHGLVIDNAGLSVDELQRYFPFPIWLIHDAVAVGLAEFERQRSLDQAFYLGLSRSVAGVLLLGEKLHQGSAGFAGEIGHVRIHDDGKRCYCGQYGCADPYLNSSVLSKEASGRIPDFFAAVNANVEVAKGVLAGYLEDLAIAIHNVRTITGAPIILGGDVGPYLPPYMDTLCALVDELSFKEDDFAKNYLSTGSRTLFPVATGAAVFITEEFNRSLSLPPKQG